MHVFVDASGDSGTQGKGERWLVIAGVADTGAPGALDARLADVRRRSPYPDDRPVHFASRPHMFKRGALEAICQEEWTAFVVASETTEIRANSALGLAVPQTHYNYALKYVLERASQLAAIAGEPLEFTIEEYGGFSLDSFLTYLRRAKRSSRIDLMEWSVVDESRINVVAKDEEHRPSVADGVAHAVFRALTPEGPFDVLEDAYLRIIGDHLWRWRGGSALRRGFTFMPTSLEDALLKEYGASITDVVAG